MKQQGSILQRSVLVLFVLLASGIGRAQSEAGIIKVSIPFDFNIGSHRFSAGEYSMKPLMQNMTSLRTRDGRVVTTITSNSVESRSVPSSVKLIFNRYSERYFLSQIWEAGNEIGRELPRSSAEAEVAGEYSPEESIALNFASRRSIESHLPVAFSGPMR